MSIVLEEVCAPPLEALTAEIPAGGVVGLIGDDAAAIEAALMVAGGFSPAARGKVVPAPPARWLGFHDELNLQAAGTLVMHHALARHDAVTRMKALIALERIRRDGACILIASHEQDLLRCFCDELWWLSAGRLRQRGHPGEVLDAYNRDVAKRMVDWGAAASRPLAPVFRRGNGHARLLELQTLNAQQRPVSVWHSGEEVAVRLRIRFDQDVADPVAGILIRTRIGLEVYGTNTELEGLHFGPCRAGEQVEVLFCFRCDLCPQQYTLTAASHDPDGVWHDWLEDAVAFSVAAPRYTAGVADLRARVRVIRPGA